MFLGGGESSNSCLFSRQRMDQNRNQADEEKRKKRKEKKAKHAILTIPFKPQLIPPHVGTALAEDVTPDLLTYLRGNPTAINYATNLEGSFRQCRTLSHYYKRCECPSR